MKWRDHGQSLRMQRSAHTGPVLHGAREILYRKWLSHHRIAAAIGFYVDPTDAFDRALSPEEIMDKLEERVGPKGRKLFEQFLRKVNKLHAQQHLEAQAQMGVTERSGERGPG